ncbi:MAG: phosphoribosylglycinamide formyltransferase [Bacteroidia bacterium]
MKKAPIRIAIFASGGGSNAEAIMQHLQGSSSGEVVLVCTNKSTAGVLDRAKRFDIPTAVLPKTSYTDSQTLITLMEEHRIDLIVLAGYLKLIPEAFTRHFHKRILNIHPGLIPEFGGKGMYGMNVHKAVIEQQAPASGITIHFVDDQYDHGMTILQHAIPVDPDWSPEELSRKVLTIEHHWFPQIVVQVCNDLYQNSHA